MIILGIETSCDETSCAVLIGDEIKSNVVSSQVFHSQYGGVIPELASRAHIKLIVPIAKEALKKANITKKKYRSNCCNTISRFNGSTSCWSKFCQSSFIFF